MLERLKLETWRLWKERESRALLLAAVLLTGLGLWQGAQFSQGLARGQAKELEKDGLRLKALHKTVADAESGKLKPEAGKPDPRSSVVFAIGAGAPLAHLPVLPSAPLAIGQSDLLPGLVKANLANRTQIFEAQDFVADQVVHPAELQSGHLDLGFVAVALLPLLALAWAFGLVSAEREGGTLALALSSPLHPRDWVLGRLGAFWLSLSLAVGLPVALVLAWAGALGSAAGWGLLLAALLALSLYLGVWLAAAAWVNRWGRSSAFNAIALGTLWLGWVLVWPAVAGVGAALIAPPPSRMQMLVEMREIANPLAKDNFSSTAQFYLQHPELLSRGQVPEYTKMWQNRTYAVQQATDAAIEPIFDAQQRQQERHERWAKRLAWGSPAPWLQQILSVLAGTDSGRHQRFVREALAYKAKLKSVLNPKIFGQLPLESADFERLGSFGWKEAGFGSLLKGLLAPLGALLALLALFLALALRGLRRGELLAQDSGV